MNVYNAKDVGKRIQEKRKSMKMSQGVLAEEIDISTKYMGIIEQGKQTMSVEILFNIAEKLNSSADYLLCREKHK